MLMTRDDICGLARLTLIRARDCLSCMAPRTFWWWQSRKVGGPSTGQYIKYHFYQQFKYLDVAHTRKFVV